MSFDFQRLNQRPIDLRAGGHIHHGYNNIGLHFFLTKMEDFVSSRELHPPRQLVNASKDGGGPFSKMCILSDSFVMVRDNELYYTPVIDTNPMVSPQTLVEDPKSLVIQSFILDCGTCEKLASRNVFFALTCEFSLLIGFRVRPETFAFNEVVESFYSEAEVDQALLDAPTAMHMTANPSLIVIGTLRRIVLVSVNIDAIVEQIEEMELRSSVAAAYSSSSFSDHDQPQHPAVDVEIVGDFILGEKLFDIRLDDYIFLDDVRENYANIDEDIAAIYHPQVTQISMWAHDRLHFTAVVVGDGNWIRFMPLELNEVEGVWEDAELPHKMHSSQPSPLIWISDHEAWISALTTAAECATIYATGDHSGSITFWRPVSAPQGDVIYEKEFGVANASGISGARIESIIEAPMGSVTDGLYIGDSSGAVLCVKVDFKNRVIENVWKIRLFPPGSSPTVARWNPFEFKKDTMLETKKDEDIFVHSDVLGVVYKCRVHKQIAGIFNTAHGNDDVRQHKSFVEVCAVLVELDALVTVGSHKSAFVWRISNGDLIETIHLPEYFVTSVATYDVGYVVGGIARILFGFASGRTLNYLVQVEQNRGGSLPHPDGVGKVSALEGSLVMDNRAEDAPLSSQNDEDGTAIGSLAEDITSVDILNDVTGERTAEEGAERDLPTRDSNGAPALADIEFVQGDLRGPIEDEFKLIAELQNSTTYCPMPVTDIFISSLGLYFAFIFSKQQIVVHEWESHRALHQIQLDDSLVDISVVSQRGLDDIDSDVLVLALQGDRGVKFLDALSGSIIEEYPLYFMDSDRDFAPPKVSRMWYFMSSHQAVRNTKQFKELDVFGICGGHEGAGFSAFIKNMPLAPLLTLNNNLPSTETRPGRLSNKLEHLVLGGHGISDYVSPLASIWTIRHGLLMRSHEGKITRVLDYQVIDDKARVVHTSALKILAQIRANRALVVLSDGTVFVLQV